MTLKPPFPTQARRARDQVPVVGAARVPRGSRFFARARDVVVVVRGPPSDRARVPPTYRHAATSSRAAAAAQYSRDDEGESDEEAESSKVSHAQSLKRGTQVTIHRTENVQQRAPHLIGRIGTIKEVPQHPNTWFTGSEKGDFF